MKKVPVPFLEPSCGKKLEAQWAGREGLATLMASLTPPPLKGTLDLKNPKKTG